MVVSTQLKNMLVKLDHFPNFRGENKTYLSCHHLGIDWDWNPLQKSMVFQGALDKNWRHGGLKNFPGGCHFPTKTPTSCWTQQLPTQETVLNKNLSNKCNYFVYQVSQLVFLSKLATGQLGPTSHQPLQPPPNNQPLPRCVEVDQKTALAVFVDALTRTINKRGTNKIRDGDEWRWRWRWRWRWNE